VAALRTQLNELQGLLDDAVARDAAREVQLQSLGSQLNTALARVAASERRQRELEAAERQRLEQELERRRASNEDLEKFRSEFFGRLRDVLGSQEGVQIVGDRFVFSSEVLFAPGSADLSFEGENEIAKVAGILRNVADDIPPEIDWVIQVDGHTDNIPLGGAGRYRNNWELSQGRALSVVQYMISALDIPPERLSANGFGQYQPIDPGDSPVARARNRRIELKLTGK
jgi:chemotaxis protein MotB